MLEVTESALMEDAESAIAALQELKSCGVLVCVDDFGTGYSSLSYLHRFPVDMLKIDRSFVARMGAGTEEQIAELVRSIVALAKGLGLGVIAEGVETEGQLDSLAALGCDYAQGYLFAAPLDAEAALHWVSSDRAARLLPLPEPAGQGRAEGRRGG
jgi:EAL domain-containing protein (putative c-di-GMP-specific phosphodiesterase class I)